MAILSNLCVMRSPAMAGLILEIFQYIHPKGTYFVAPAVKIFARLELRQNSAFYKGLAVSIDRGGH